MDNYRISRDRAQRYFLGFDQKKILKQWDLRHDENWLYVNFLAREYRICRTTGGVFRCDSEEAAEHAEVLSIFDLLCHQGENKTVTGVFAPVNSLKGLPRGAGVSTDFHGGPAAVFDKDPETFHSACLALGGQPVQMGDIGFRFPVFGPLSVILKFYHSDMDFPASVTILWEENTLQFLFYETVFYIAGFLLQTIENKMSSILQIPNRTDSQ